MPVYFIRAGDGGPVKIGWSAKAGGVRLNQMQVSNHERLNLIRLVETFRRGERWYHARYEARRVRGEWFSFCEDMLVAIPPSEAALAVKSYASTPFGRVLLATGMTLDSGSRALGVHPTAIHRWANGERTVPRRYVADIAEKFGVSPREVRPDLYHVRAS
jgi:hypothetical protein